MGYMYVIGDCLVCHQPFMFNADHVPSFPINGIREPICSTCIVHVNEQRALRDLPQWPIHPDAYEPEETL
jgi:hypothetical protein